MKKFNLLLLAISLQTSSIFAEEQSGLIFWSDYNYFKDSTRPISQNDNSYFKLSSNTIDLPPFISHQKPTLPPTPIPSEHPHQIKPSKIPSPKNGYIFYNKFYYPGKTLYTNKPPLTGYTLFNKNTLIIENTPHNTSTTGMQASRGGTVVNDGSIKINGLYGNGINIIDNGTGINNGDIYLNSLYATGIQVYGKAIGINNGNISGNGYDGAQVIGNGHFINSPTGVIDITNGNIGVSTYNGGTATNNGTIKISNTNFGMFSSEGTIINNGTLIIEDNSKNTNNVLSSGMGICKTGIAINNGTINIKSNSYAFQIAHSALGINTSNGVVNLNKNGILLDENGTLHNWGKIIKPIDNTLPLVYRGGKLVMEKGGTIITPPNKGSIKTIYLGKSYIGNNYNLISKATLDDTLTKSAKEIKSNLYNYKLTLRGNEAIFNKVRFSLLTNDPLGNYLENIYYDSKNISKNRLFDIILSSKNSDNFENYLNQIFGRGYFPSLIYQTRDTIEYGNNSILSHLTKSLRILSKERYIFGYSFEKINKNSYDNILGYSQELNNLFIGKNFPLTSSISSGWIFNYTKLNNKFKNDYGNREDNLFQGTGYLSYDNNNFNGFGALFLGYSKGDLNRNIQFDYSQYNNTLTSIKTVNFNETSNSKIKNFYIGGIGKISKIFNWNSFYVEPMGKFQSMGIFQKNINEHNGTYNLDLDKLNGFFNTFYLGGDFGKEFNIKNYGVELSLMGYLKQDLNNFNKNMKFKIQTLGNETGTIDIDNKNRFSQEIGINLQIKKLPAGFSIYINYLYEFSKDDPWKISTGINYIF